jgi:hypothetical protein
VVTVTCLRGYGHVSPWLRSRVSVVTVTCLPGYSHVSPWLQSRVSVVTVTCLRGYGHVSLVTWLKWRSDGAVCERDHSVAMVT